MLNPVPLPLGDPISQPKRARFGTGIDPLEGLISQTWADAFTSLMLSLSRSPQILGSTDLDPTQAASIGATDLSGGALSAGIYRLTYYARITTPGTVSSSLTVTFGWTDTAVACSFSDAAITGNTTATTGSWTRLLYSDGASPITYATTYASVGATPMQYSLRVVLERGDA